MTVFSLRLIIVSPGQYRICMSSDDGGFLNLNGERVLNTWNSEACVDRNMTSGGHDIYVQQEEGYGGDYCYVTYQGPDTNNQKILMPNRAVLGPCAACVAGTYSTASGASAAETCRLCIAGTYSTGTAVVSSASCEGCLTGQFSTASGAPASSTCAACSSGTYATQQQATACTSCPSNSGTGGSTGSTQRGQCVCDPGYVGNLANLAQTCAACPANSYCAGLSQASCPSNTRSPPLSSQALQCRCVAGYRCTYRRNATADFRFNLSPDSFISRNLFTRSALAFTADVPLSHVALVSYKGVAGLPPAAPPPPPPTVSDM